MLHRLYTFGDVILLEAITTHINTFSQVYISLVILLEAVTAHINTFIQVYISLFILLKAVFGKIDVMESFIFHPKVVLLFTNECQFYSKI